MLIKKLTSLYGVGPVQAESLRRKLLQTFTPKELEKMSENEVRNHLKRAAFFNDLHTATKIDLLYKPLKEIPRNVITMLEKEMKKYLSAAQFDIAGSYRRGKSMSHDIDIVMLNDVDIMKINRSDVIYAHPPYAKGAHKITQLMDVGKSRVKVDIFLTTQREYMFALLFAIGSGQFNIRMRSIAKRKGFLLNQHGLYKKDCEGKLVRIAVKTEKDLFKKLNIKYIEPKERV
jgi:DNA polymerase/3'-5' exonuclease PolX